MSTDNTESPNTGFVQENYRHHQTDENFAETESNSDLNVNSSRYVDSSGGSTSSKTEDYQSQEEAASVGPNGNGSKMLRYGKEVVCLLALILTTLATIQNKPSKVGRAPQPKSFFPKMSVVQDWPGGQLDMLQVRVSMSELSLVFFYAPWCAESEFARNPYESVANIFHEEVYFAAVNCWQPGGECRLQYSKVHAWPVLMAYYQGGTAIQYTGQWNFHALIKFIEGLKSPIYRLTSTKALLKMRAEHEAVITGFFMSIQSDKFLSYLKAAIKWLEEDPFQDLRFTVVTGTTTGDFNSTQDPSIRLYLWNETVSYPDSKWTPENITLWVKKVARFNNPWINLPAKKSSLLASHLKDTPSVLVFTPREYFLKANAAYFVVKQVAWEYSTCQNSSWLQDVKDHFILTQGTENLKRLEDLKIQCQNIKPVIRNMAERSSCYTEISNMTGNIVNIMRHLDCTEPSKNYCPIKYNYQHTVNSDSDISMIRTNKDDRSAKNLLDASKKRLCRKLELSPKVVPSIQVYNTSIPPVNGSGCMYENNLSFAMLDSTLYSDFSEKLNAGALNNPDQTAVFIVNNKSETTFQMDESFSLSSLRSFVKNFHEKNLERKLRKKEIKPKFEHLSSSKVKIAEVNFNTIKDTMEFSNSTLVILFYSSQCALCSLISQSLLKISKILKSLDINYLRVDGDENDFPWQYTMDSYPTLIISPRNKRMETRIFPPNMEVNEKNILGFILANLHLTERLQALAEFCHTIKANIACQSCVSVLRKETLKSIQVNLRLWRHNPLLRKGVIRRLQILQKAYMLLFRTSHTCDMRHFRNRVVVLRNIWKETSL